MATAGPDDLHMLTTLVQSALEQGPKEFVSQLIAGLMAGGGAAMSDAAAAATGTATAGTVPTTSGTTSARVADDQMVAPDLEDVAVAVDGVRRVFNSIVSATHAPTPSVEAEMVAAVGPLPPPLPTTLDVGAGAAVADALTEHVADVETATVHGASTLAANPTVRRRVMAAILATRLQLQVDGTTLRPTFDGDAFCGWHPVADTVAPPNSGGMATLSKYTRPDGKVVSIVAWKPQVPRLMPGGDAQQTRLAQQAVVKLHVEQRAHAATGTKGKGGAVLELPEPEGAAVASAGVKGALKVFGRRAATTGAFVAVFSLGTLFQEGLAAYAKQVVEGTASSLVVSGLTEVAKNTFEQANGDLLGSGVGLVFGTLVDAVKTAWGGNKDWSRFGRNTGKRGIGSVCAAGATFLAAGASWYITVPVTIGAYFLGSHVIGGKWCQLNNLTKAETLQKMREYNESTRPMGWELQDRLTWRKFRKLLAKSPDKLPLQTTAAFSSNATLVENQLLRLAKHLGGGNVHVGLQRLYDAYHSGRAAVGGAANGIGGR